MPNLLRTMLATGALAASTAASAIPFGGVEFPQGAISFADQVVNYAVGGGGVAAPYQGSDRALGVPDYAGANGCANQPSCTFVSLGDGGSVTLRFTDNVLTGSGNADLDLWIFEIGPDVEDTFVEVSKDGLTYFAVGKVFGATSGIDLDAFGFGTADEFRYVRLTDDTDEGQQSGPTTGADIDAVGAISTRPASHVPEPGTLALMGLALTGLAMLGLRRRPAR